MVILFLIFFKLYEKSSIGNYSQVHILANSMTIEDCPFSEETNIFFFTKCLFLSEKIFLSNKGLCSDGYPVMSAELLVGE